MSLIRRCDICGGIEGVDETPNGQISFSDAPYKVEITNYNEHTFNAYISINIENNEDVTKLHNMIETYSEDELNDLTDDDGNLYVDFEIQTPNPKICNICSKKILGSISIKQPPTQIPHKLKKKVVKKKNDNTPKT